MSNFLLPLLLLPPLLLLSGLLLLLLWILLLQLVTIVRFRSHRCNIPAAKHWPIIGSVTFRDLAEERLQNYRDLGNIFYISMFHLGVIGVADPELIYRIFIKENFPRSRFHSWMAELWGESLITIPHGENMPWKERRQSLNPAFKFSSLRSLHSIFAAQSVIFTKKIEEFSKSKTSFDAQQEFLKVTLDTISNVGFSYDLGAIHHPPNDFLKSLNKIFLNIVNPLVLLGLTGPLRYFSKKNHEAVDKLFLKVIEDRIRKKQESKEGDETKPPQDLLDIMLTPNEDGMMLTQEQIKNELFLFYLAGTETSTTTLSWALYYLTQNPEVEEKLIQEIESVMGTATNGEIEAPSTAQIEEMNYLTMVFNETLRLHPPVMGISRIIPETFEYNGFIFPKGFEVSAFSVIVHRNPDIWPNPEKFDPERFSKENSEGRHLCSFIPFSAGQRICLGRNFFYHEAKVLFATMLRKFKFQLDPHKVSGKWASMANFTPNAVWVTASPRT